MLLLVNTDRRLAGLAADARLADGANRRWIGGAPWRSRTNHVEGPDVGVPVAARDDVLADLVRIAVVGEPDEVTTAFATDAIGWSPAIAFTCRVDAAEARREPAAAIAVEAFAVDILRVAADVVVAEWHLSARQTDPLLIDQDLLLEATGQTVQVCGATILSLRDDQIATVRTYYDDATVMEQLLADR